MTGKTLVRIEAGEPTTSQTLQRIRDAFGARGIVFGPGGVGPLRRRHPPEAATQMLRALVEQLPPVSAQWSRAERIAWLRAMATVQTLIFEPADPAIDIAMDGDTGVVTIEGEEVAEP